MFFDFNEIITELSAKNKYYRMRNEKLIILMNQAADIQKLREIERGEDMMDEHMRVSSKMQRRADSLRACGTFIKLTAGSGNKVKISGGNFCRQKLCAMCSKNRSIKRFAQMANVLDQMQRDGLIYGKSGQIVGMITLTQRNVPIEELNEEINNLAEGCKRLFNRRTWKSAITGWAKSIEITYNQTDKTFHPHIHILAIINTSKGLTNPMIQEYWKQSMKLDYFPQCDVREAYGDTPNLRNIILECLKYNVKQNQVSSPLLDKLNVLEFTELMSALRGRRLVSYGGEIATYRQQLEYMDEDKDKSIDIEIPGETSLPNAAQEIALAWSEQSAMYVVINHYE